MIKPTIAAVTATLLCTATPAGAVTLVNGSFETSTPAANPGAGFTSLAGGSTAITGWTAGTTVGGIDYIGGYWQAAQGSRSIDLAGSGRGSIYQDVATVVGQIYRLTFFLAGNPDGGAATKSIGVFIGSGDLEMFSVTRPAGTTRVNMNWQQFTYDFTADSTTSRITFAAATPASSPYGPALDNVSVAAVPEPATWGMMILGFGMAGYGLRRRKSNVRTTVSFA